MPTLTHESILLLLDNRPALAVELLEVALGRPLEPYEQIQPTDSGLPQVVSTEYQADRVLLLRRDKPVFAIVVEVQRNRDPRKRYTWPVYCSSFRAKHECPCCVLVIATDPSIAAWAAHPIELGQPESAFRPLVIGPEGIPLVITVEEARRAPELAVLSVQAHGAGEHGLAVTLAALEAATDLDRERSMLYCDLIWLAAGDAVKKTLEDQMERAEYQYQSDFAKKYIAEGKAEGKAEGRAEAIVRILQRRSVALSSEQRQRILACADLTLLDTWLDRAAVAETAADVFDPE